MSFCIGLTGNLASGKSTAAKIFAELGVEVINADALSKELSQKGGPAYQSIIDHFGQELLQADGQINRASLRSIIFSQASERKWLENLLHPMIREAIQEKVQQCKSDYCIIEIPLHIDRNIYPYIKRVLLITAPIDVQIARVQERDHCSRDHALAILATQPDMDVRLQHADDVVINDKGLEELRVQIEQLHKKYVSYAIAL